MSKVIGEGTYGCIHKPALKCKDKNISHKNKVSKLLYNIYAEEELKEYGTISKLDKKKDFHLGKPTRCEVDTEEPNKSAIIQCAKGTEYLSNKNDISLLIMKYGGANIEDFADNIIARGSNVETVEKFWIDVHTMLLALKLFQENGIVHHDVKPQNIVYNPEKREMRLIDFGIMTSVDKIKGSSNNSDYWLSIQHWSFPFELAFYNKSDYERLASSRPRVMQYYNHLITKFQTQKNMHKDIQNLRTFFNYMNVRGRSSTYNQDRVQKYWKDFYNFIMKIGTISHAEFIDISSKTIDLYGIGIALAYAYSATHSYLSTEMQSHLEDFIYSLTTPNVFTRLTPEQAAVQYENILDESGFLSKYKTNANKVDETLPTSVRDKIRSIKLDNIEVSPEDIERIINQPLHTNAKICPQGKEMNPKTGRCNNVCKNGYVRNTSFKCVKLPTKTNVVENGCPQGKEMNPKTRRCNNVCKNGYVRNESFKCVKLPIKPKDVDVPKRAAANRNGCPQGKEMNPKTRRCNNVCKDGYIRNAAFKCVKNKTAKRKSPK